MNRPIFLIAMMCSVLMALPAHSGTVSIAGASGVATHKGFSVSVAFPDVAITPGGTTFNPVPFPLNDARHAPTKRTNSLGKKLVDFGFDVLASKDEDPTGSLRSVFAATLDAESFALWSDGLLTIRFEGPTGDLFALPAIIGQTDEGDTRLSFDVTSVPFHDFNIFFDATITDNDADRIDAFNVKSLSLESVAVPEPTTTSLILCGLLFVAAWLARRRRFA